MKNTVYEGKDGGKEIKVDGGRPASGWVAWTRVMTPGWGEVLGFRRQLSGLDVIRMGCVGTCA